ncbi:DUF2795 domain-containing protein [Phycicoccus endophyticus]|uniref:DUF2795 domain-containing protein n=1 Tax=Phycicoccus endophyticus TaxID=1690220 RepID=A0A7G9R173_9MICO|nr:DUF2795 domain-containing protein [Phycicoccus endophyticus]NHI20520.1 DUF2795 domain-containing protein [Phycicoccus endophyticus]QNN49348.1 DUF2795 domain-containing protein [Phycicoccus endophyticus]GGL45191.1 hypothetical protein GCM10012283_29750 [Phycicoccus endophyticus]
MSTVHGAGGADPEATLAADLAGLRVALAEHPFPTRQDDLIAACIGRGVPARLCCRLSRLTRTREYASMAEVCADIVRVEEEAHALDG